MVKTREQIEKLVDAYLDSGHIHKFSVINIIKEDISNKKSEIWKEIAFYKYVSNFYPIFKKFYSYNIVSDCKFIKNNNSIGLSVSGFPMYEKLQKSNYCIEYISSYEENTLGTIIDKLNIKQLYSLILQILCGIKILQDKKYTQNDLNIMNITYNKTTKKYTTIKSKNITYKIPVFDYIYTIIDYKYESKSTINYYPN